MRKSGRILNGKKWRNNVPLNAKKLQRGGGGRGAAAGLSPSDLTPGGTCRRRRHVDEPLHVKSRLAPFGHGGCVDEAR